MQIKTIPMELTRVLLAVCQRFDGIEVVTVHPHEPANQDDVKPDLWMIAAEFENGSVYFGDIDAMLCKNESYCDSWLRRMERDLDS